MKLKANGIDIEVEDSGGDGPAVLLLMGLGMQLVAWPRSFVQGFTDAGYRVIRHDNRDIGLSRHFDELGEPNLLWSMLKTRLGLDLRAPYTLKDMARDSLGVLDALHVRDAHVIGVSMGGMIAQRVALLAPGRCRSLTSIMSSSGAPGLPGPRPEVVRALLSRPRSAAPRHLIEHAMALYQLIGSPSFPHDDAELRARVIEAGKRSYNPAGVRRQMLAIAADTRRCRELHSVEAPTLVLHGRDDPLVPFACGEDTARRIPGARLEAIAGMGHDLPPGLIGRLLELILPHLAAADASGGNRRQVA